jgi:creatinine amidohydrolase
MGNRTSTRPLLRLGEAHPADLTARLAELPALILPLGTIEYHGNHLPLGLDGLKAEAIAREAARLSGATLAPTSWWSADGVSGPYTLRLPRALVQGLLAEVLEQLARMRIAVIAVVNGHYGLQNSIATRSAALSCMHSTDTTVLAIADYEVLLELGAEGDHAGVFETALMAAERPDLVRLDERVEQPLAGVIGLDPRGRASAALGASATAHAATRISAAIDHALRFSRNERDAYVAALTAGVAALERIADLRQMTPRELVPPVQTPEWLAHIRALHEGDFGAALQHATNKRDQPDS